MQLHLRGIVIVIFDGGAAAVWCGACSGGYGDGIPEGRTSMKWYAVLYLPYVHPYMHIFIRIDR